MRAFARAAGPGPVLQDNGANTPWTRWFPADTADLPPGSRMGPQETDIPHGPFQKTSDVMGAPVSPPSRRRRAHTTTTEPGSRRVATCIRASRPPVRW